MSSFLDKMKNIEKHKFDNYVFKLSASELEEDKQKCDVWIDEIVDMIKQRFIEDAQNHAIHKRYSYTHKSLLEGTTSTTIDKDHYHYTWAIPCVIVKDKRICDYELISYYSYQGAEFPSKAYALKCNDYQVYEYFLSQVVQKLLQEKIRYYNELRPFKQPTKINKKTLLTVKEKFDMMNDKKTTKAEETVPFKLEFYYFP